MQTSGDNPKEFWGAVNEKTAKIEQPGSADMIRWGKDTHMALNEVIRSRMEVIKPIQLTADPHVENIEVVHLDFGKRTPDM